MQQMSEVLMKMQVMISNVEEQISMCSSSLEMKPEAQMDRSEARRAAGRAGLSPETPEPYRGTAKKLTRRLNIETRQGSTHTLSYSLALVAVTWVKAPTQTSALNLKFKLISLHSETNAKRSNARATTS